MKVLTFIYPELSKYSGKLGQSEFKQHSDPKLELVQYARSESILVENQSKFNLSSHSQLKQKLNIVGSQP